MRSIYWCLKLQSIEQKCVYKQTNCFLLFSSNKNFSLVKPGQTIYVLYLLEEIFFESFMFICNVLSLLRISFEFIFVRILHMMKFFSINFYSLFIQCVTFCRVFKEHNNNKQIENVFFFNKKTKEKENK